MAISNLIMAQLFSHWPHLVFFTFFSYSSSATFSNYNNTSSIHELWEELILGAVTGDAWRIVVEMEKWNSCLGFQNSTTESGVGERD